jgi:hypothetical protein
MPYLLARGAVEISRLVTLTTLRDDLDKTKEKKRNRKIGLDLRLFINGPFFSSISMYSV